MKGPIDVTEDNEETYTSSNLSQFAWTEDPSGSRGLLYVEFKGGRRYLYEDVPESVFDEMSDRAYGRKSGKSTGEFFHNEVVPDYDRHGIDYHKFEEVLE